MSSVPSRTDAILPSSDASPCAPAVDGRGFSLLLAVGAAIDTAPAPVRAAASTAAIVLSEPAAAAPVRVVSPGLEEELPVPPELTIARRNAVSNEDLLTLDFEEHRPQKERFNHLE